MSSSNDAPDLRVALFGTYDERSHPRVSGLREGLQEVGVRVDVLNAPLRFGTDARVALVSAPGRSLAGFVVRVAWCWLRLIWCRIRCPGRFDAVVIGYMGHLDVHLARLLFPFTPLVLDHMVGLGDTARDRSLDGRASLNRLLATLDRAALRQADLVLFDTEEHRRHLGGVNEREMVVPVGAPSGWFVSPKHERRAAQNAPLNVVFYGLYTPLHGAATIGEAIALLADDDRIEFEMIGDGQDRPRVRSIASSAHVRWVDWVEAEELPRHVAASDVCLGIFGTSSKALRVVPNKAYQGCAAGTVVVTSDTLCQRETLGDDAAVFVPAGDSNALAHELRALAADRERLARMRAAALTRARECFTPSATVRELVEALRELTVDR